MIYKDQDGNEFEEVEKYCLPEAIRAIRPVVKKPKWSVINTYYDPTDDHIAIILPHPINHAQIEAIKAFIEASLEYIYNENRHTDPEDYIITKLKKTRRAIEEANG